MAKFESVAVPFLTVNGRQCLTGIQIMEMPELGDFIAAFPDCFAKDERCDVVWYYPQGDAPR